MKKIALLFATALIFYACQNTANNGNAASTTATPASTTTTTASTTAKTQPATIVPATRKIAEKSITGKLVEAMDMDYPRAFVTVQAGPDKISANFSEEDPNAYKIADVKKLLKKQVVMLIVEQKTTSVVEIVANGKSIYEGGSFEMQPTYKKITGMLNSKEITTGDLPGMMSLSTADGTIYEFNHFVTGAEAAQNGKTVDLYYDEVQNNELISIEAIK